MAILMLAGVVLALMNWQRHQKPSLLVLIASVLGLLRIPVSLIFNYWVIRPHGAAGNQVIFTLWGVGMTILYCLIYVLLLAAAFIGRSTETIPK